MTEINQGQFNFESESDTNGYQRWQEELDATKLSLERKYGIILHSKVRLELKNYNKPIEGTIRLLPNQTSKAKEPTLTISSLSRLTFTPRDIHSITRI